MRGSNMHVWLQRECVEGACLRCSSVCGSSVYCVRLECGATPGRSEMTTAICNVELLSLAVMHNITLNHKTLSSPRGIADRPYYITVLYGTLYTDLYKYYYKAY